MLALLALFAGAVNGVGAGLRRQPPRGPGEHARAGGSSGAAQRAPVVSRAPSNAPLSTGAAGLAAAAAAKKPLERAVG